MSAGVCFHTLLLPDMNVERRDRLVSSCVCGADSTCRTCSRLSVRLSPGLKLCVNPIAANWVKQLERGGLFDFKQPLAAIC